MQNTPLVKVGPWGGQGGGARDVNTQPQRLTSWTIRSGAAIYAIAFTYVDIDGKNCNSGLWGGNAGTPQKVISECNTWF